jgi:Trk K+ transport system NAD-binding subunit
MAFRSRRTVYYLVLVVVTTLFFTGSYNVGMAIWENRPQPLYRSLEVVIQSFTTTGYGEDAPWQTPQMNGLVMLMQLAGIGLILTAVDVFAVPWLRSALAPTAPTAISDLDEHVLICEHTPRTDAFIAELEARDREYCLVESDTDTAGELHEAEYRVIEGDPESLETLLNARVDAARCVVIDSADDTSASIALSVREANPDVSLLTLLEDADLTQYHRAAGVDEILLPRQLLGESLAGQVPTAVTTEITDSAVISDEFELVELTVAAESDLVGQTFHEAALRERFGVNVIGAWFESNFKTPIDPNEVLAPGTRLLVAGESDQVASLREATVSSVSVFSSSQVVIAGHGDTGGAAHDVLSRGGSDLTVLDIESNGHVDVVGDAREPDVLREAGIPDADALIVAVGDDTTAIFTTLIASQLNPELRIVVRATEQADVEKLYQAGADYVQSLATVSGRMLASKVFENEEVLTYGTQVSVVRLPAGDLAGTTLAATDVRTETGGTVVAVVRDETTITEFDPSAFVFEADDSVIIAGTDQAITEFEQQFIG